MTESKKAEKRNRNSIRLKQFRKQLRNHSTMAEKSLWKLLKNKNLDHLKFRRQYSIDDYILDFYCPKLKLAIELDGDYHYHVQQPVKDGTRDAVLLERYGITTLRFENNVVLEQFYVVANAILDFEKRCNERKQI